MRATPPNVPAPSVLEATCHVLEATCIVLEATSRSRSHLSFSKPLFSEPPSARAAYDRSKSSCTAHSIMMEMSVAATVPGGGVMEVQVNGQMMGVQVPPGIQPGQAFTFQVAAPQPTMAQPVMAQPVMAQPVMAQPVMSQPMVQGQPMMVQGQANVVMPMSLEPAANPPGAPPGGQYMTEAYCGDQTILATVLVAIFFWPATCCIPACKCDQRVVYRA